MEVPNFESVGGTPTLSKFGLFPLKTEKPFY
jgi:hypothetical protein